MRSPAFQFYVDDFVAGTVSLSPEEVGAYIRLLCFQWNNGYVPDSADKRARIAGCPVSADVLAKFQATEEGVLRNKRLELVRADQVAYRTKQAENARTGWRNRRSGNATALPPHMPNQCQNDATALPPHMPEGMPKACSPSPSPISNTQGQPVELPSGFPQSEEEASSYSDFVGCTKDFAVTQWRLAASRGGRDAKDVPIRSWRHYLGAMRAFAANGLAEQKHRNGATKPQPPPNETPEQREKRLLKESL